MPAVARRLRLGAPAACSWSAIMAPMVSLPAQVGKEAPEVQHALHLFGQRKPQGIEAQRRRVLLQRLPEVGRQLFHRLRQTLSVRCRPAVDAHRPTLAGVLVAQKDEAAVDATRSGTRRITASRTSSLPVRLARSRPPATARETQASPLSGIGRAFSMATAIWSARVRVTKDPSSPGPRRDPAWISSTPPYAPPPAGAASLSG